LGWAKALLRSNSIWTEAPPVANILTNLGNGSSLGNGANPKNQTLMQLAIADDGPLMAVCDLGLWMLSYMEPSEMNLLINPAHRDYRKIVLTIERHPFTFDPRLF
jgi:hypothetical protein